MSKTSQKKFSAYQCGLDDGIQGLPFRWSQHPKLEHYRAGYRDGSRARQPQRPREMTLVERIVFVIFGYS